MNVSIIILQNNQMWLLTNNRRIIPFNQIGERVPQLFWSTQEVGIRTSIFWWIGRYQAFFNSESHNCRSSFWHDVDRSSVTGRIIWLSESQGSVNQTKKNLKWVIIWNCKLYCMQLGRIIRWYRRWIFYGLDYKLYTQ